MERKNSICREKAFHFAIRIVKLHRYLNDQKEYILSKQILRSGTSIGANIEEAESSISKKEFPSKISISYKEARETDYWLRLLCATGSINEKLFQSLSAECQELCRILFAILRTTRIKK
jgi:four helix bundle protein